MGFFAEPLGSAPDARAYFFLRRQEKVAKKKATPALRGRLRRLPCATRKAGRLRNSGLRPSNSARRLPPASLRCSALHEGGPENQLSVIEQGLKRNTKDSEDRSVLNPPWKTPSNAGLSGEVGEHCLRAKPELRSPRSRRVAEGAPPQAGRRPGAAFSLAPFFWRSKRKDARASGAENSASVNSKGRRQLLSDTGYRRRYDGSSGVIACHP
jgi:hypothetical protein